MKVRPLIKDNETSKTGIFIYISSADFILNNIPHIYVCVECCL